MDTEAFITFIDSVKPILETATLVVLGIIASLGTVFGLYVGFKLARAEDEGRRREAKQQLLWSILATIVVVTIFVLLSTLLNPDTGIFSGRAPITITNPEGEIVVEEAIKIIAVIDRAVDALLSLFSIGAMLFAIYLGIRLAMAEDENKRKEAKAQVFWTLIAVIIALSLAVIISQVMITVANEI